MTKEPKSAASDEGAAPESTTEKLLRIRWNPGRRGHLVKYQFAEGHAATWDSDGTDNHPIANVPEAFWNEYGSDIRAIAGGTFTVLDGED